MTATTDNRKYTGDGANLGRSDIARAWNGPVAAGEVLYTGALAGHLLADTAKNPAIYNYVADGTMRCIGFVTLGCDNSGGALNAVPCRVVAQTGTLVDKNAGGGSAIAVTDLYKPIYGADNQTCSKLPADGYLIGILVGIDRESGKPVVLVDPVVNSSFVKAKASAYTQTYDTANRTIANPTHTALTDSTTGSAGSTLAAGVGVQTLTIPLTSLATGLSTAAIDLLTDYVVGYKFKVLTFDWVTTVAGTGSGASQTFNLEIGSTNLTGGSLNVTLSSTDTIGKKTLGTSITGNNTGSATDTLSIEMAASGTVFTAGAGYFVIKLQNMDTADAVASIAAKLVLAIADDLDLRQGLTAVIDDLQAAGLAG